MQRGTHDELIADSAGRVLAAGLAPGAAGRREPDVFRWRDGQRRPGDRSRSEPFRLQIANSARTSSSRFAGACRGQAVGLAAIHRRGAIAVQPAGEHGGESTAGARRSRSRLVGVVGRGRRVLHPVRAGRAPRDQAALVPGRGRGLDLRDQRRSRPDRGRRWWPSGRGRRSSSNSPGAT